MFIFTRSLQALPAGMREGANRSNACLPRSGIHGPKAWFAAHFKAGQAFELERAQSPSKSPTLGSDRWVTLVSFLGAEENSQMASALDTSLRCGGDGGYTYVQDSQSHQP